MTNPETEVTGNHMKYDVFLQLESAGKEAEVQRDGGKGQIHIKRDDKSIRQTVTEKRL